MNPRLNAEWHEANVLGSGAPLDRRIDWHLEHAEVCGCRPIPDTLRAEMEARGLSIPGEEDDRPDLP